MRPWLLASLLLAACDSSVSLGNLPEDAGAVPDEAMPLSSDASSSDQSSPPGGTWTIVPSATSIDLYGVVGNQFGPEVVAVGGTPASTTGNSGIIVRYDGTTWSTTPQLVNLLGAAAAPNNVDDIRAVGVYAGEGSYIQRSSGAWSARSVLAAHALRAVWYPLSSVGDFYVVGDQGTLLRGSTLSTPATFTTVSGGTDDLYAVWGSSVSDAFAVGKNGTVLHMTTGQGAWVKTMPVFADLHGVWGSSASDLYIVGADASNVVGGAHHSTNGGQTWTAATTALPPLYAVWGSSASAVYAVGKAGAIYRTTGNNVWTQESSPTQQDLLAIWGSSSAVYAVGRNGTIVKKEQGVPDCPGGVAPSGACDTEPTCCPSGSFLCCSCGADKQWHCSP